MLALAGRAFVSVRRHALIYGLATVVTGAAEAAIVYLWQGKGATLIAATIVPPFFVTIINAFTFADESGELPAATWSRVLERSWAVLVVDILLQFMTTAAFGSIVSPSLVDRILGAAVFVIFVALTFADVHATVGSAEPWWLLVPRSLSASMTVAWHAATVSRTLIAFTVVTLVPTLVESLLFGTFDQSHVHHADLWASAVTNILLPIVQAFCALVYLDAVGYESNRSCGE